MAEVVKQMNWRKQRRWEKKATNWTAVYEAYLAGQYQAFREKPYRNPYPPGKRHQEFKKAYFLLAEEGKIELFPSFRRNCLAKTKKNC